MAGGVQVGHAVAGFRGWVAYLWNARSDPHMGIADKVTAGNLAELRWKVGQRLEDCGPWWESPGDGGGVAGTETAPREADS
jgi:hypothetical protein